MDFESFVRARGVRIETEVPRMVQWRAHGMVFPRDLAKLLGSFNTDDCPATLRDKLTDRYGEEQRAFAARLESRDWVHPKALVILDALEARGVITRPQLNREQLVGLRPLPRSSYWLAPAFLVQEAIEDVPSNVLTWLVKHGWPRWYAWASTWSPSTPIEIATVDGLSSLVLIAAQHAASLTTSAIPARWGEP